MPDSELQTVEATQISEKKTKMILFSLKYSSDPKQKKVAKSIDSLEHLIDFMELEGSPVILHPKNKNGFYELEVYDDYRE